MHPKDGLRSGIRVYSVSDEGYDMENVYSSSHGDKQTNRDSSLQSMTTWLQKGKGRAQWVFLERWYWLCCWGLHWVCSASIPSSGFSCHWYDGTLFVDTHRAECKNDHIYPIELSRRALSAAKDTSWADRVKQLPSTILSACNEPGMEKNKWTMSVDTIFGSMKCALNLNHNYFLLHFNNLYLSCCHCFSLWHKFDSMKSIDFSDHPMSSFTQF